MAIPDRVKLAAVQGAYGIAGAFVTVFTAAAGTTGANEPVGQTRVQTTYTDGTNSATSTEVNVPVAAGTYVEAGVFDAATAGNFGGSGPFSGGDVVVSGTGASIDVTLTWS